uniref:Uncharacterized protein n=1 Tax=Meloidogyne incognita TaxID=6306 RepID=A0A914KY47_MELIC
MTEPNSKLTSLSLINHFLCYQKALKKIHLDLELSEIAYKDSVGVDDILVVDETEVEGVVVGFDEEGVDKGFLEYSICSNNYPGMHAFLQYEGVDKGFVGYVPTD